MTQHQPHPTPRLHDLLLKVEDILNRLQTLEDTLTIATLEQNGEWTYYRLYPLKNHKPDHKPKKNK